MAVVVVLVVPPVIVRLLGRRSSCRDRAVKSRHREILTVWVVGVNVVCGFFLLIKILDFAFAIPVIIA